MFLSQLSLVIALATTEIWSEEAHEKFKLPDSVWVVVARFLCGTVLHFNLQSEMRQGLVVMKFSLNHPWKLKSASKAWLTGFAQTLMVIAVEGVNLVILCTNETVMDVVMNFLALVVIADFDDFIAVTLASDQLYKRFLAGDFVLKDDRPDLDHALTIESTTSLLAAAKLEAHKLK